MSESKTRAGSFRLDSAATTLSVVLIKRVCTKERPSIFILCSLLRTSSLDWLFAQFEPLILAEKLETFPMTPTSSMMKQHSATYVVKMNMDILSERIKSKQSSIIDGCMNLLMPIILIQRISLKILIFAAHTAVALRMNMVCQQRLRTDFQP